MSRRDLMALAALAAAPAALLLVFSGHAAAAPVWVQQAKLLASDGKGGDELGYSLAVSGDTVIAGTPWDSQVDNNSGAVYVYVFERSRGTWSEQQILSASDPPFGYDYFGYSVGLFGDTLVVGTLTDGGQVRYVRKRTFSDGTRELPFTPRDFVARLCALVPPPRFHQVRYHRILAAHARGRYALTGRGLHDGGVDRGRSRLDRSLGEEIMWSGEAKRSIIRAFIVSRMCGAARTAVAGLNGVSVSYDGESGWTPRRLYVTLPTGGETFTDLAGDSDEECALCAMDFLGLAHATGAE